MIYTTTYHSLYCLFRCLMMNYYILIFVYNTYIYLHKILLTFSGANFCFGLMPTDFKCIFEVFPVSDEVQSSSFVKTIDIKSLVNFFGVVMLHFNKFVALIKQTPSPPRSITYKC